MVARDVDEQSLAWTNRTPTVPPKSGVRRRVRRVAVMGCAFDPITVSNAVDQVFAWRDEPERKTHIFVTVNVSILMAMREDLALTGAIDRADAVVVDGKPLVWASRWVRSPVPEKVSGVDIMQRLLEVGGGRGLSVYLLGTTQERLDALNRIIAARYPDVRVAGSHNGFFGPDKYPEVVRGIREAHADVLLVGMPAPFKEVWCQHYRDELDTPAVIGVGGAFDVLGGIIPCAPRILQEAGLEWAWRLAMEPRKLWKRYLVTNTTFLAHLPRAIAEGRRLAPR